MGLFRVTESGYPSCSLHRITVETSTFDLTVGSGSHRVRRCSRPVVDSHLLVLDILQDGKDMVSKEKEEGETKDTKVKMRRSLVGLGTDMSNLGVPLLGLTGSNKDQGINLCRKSGPVESSVTDVELPDGSILFKNGD